MNQISKELKIYLKGFSFPQIPIKQWIKQHKITASIKMCKCKKKLYPLIPIASKKDFGVVYQQCKCGQMPPVTLVSASAQERKEDILFFKILKKELK